MDPTTISSLTTVGYTGEELIAEANLVQMGARLYDPASGVFLNPDPTVAAPFDARDWNQYAYVYDNPMSYTDPTGYEPCIQTGDKSWDCGSIGTATVFSPWSQGAMDCTEFAEQSNPACHDAIYGVPPNYGNDDVFLALAARADALARAAEKKKAVEKEKAEPLAPCTANATSRANNPNAGKNILKVGATGAAAFGVTAVAINVFGFPEAEGVEAVGGGGILLWEALAGEPVATNIIIGFNFGGLGFGAGSVVGLAVTPPVASGCQKEVR